ncbi:hypothetical protein B0H14DRAFT_2642324 [Mycena olivaceomarginata]|nr:hypothetical protein B0H14DRAFT_2642324 [Mycena olivaceomarginata]
MSVGGRPRRPERPRWREGHGSGAKLCTADTQESWDLETEGRPMFKVQIEDTSGNWRVEEVQGRVEAAKCRGGKLNTAGAPSELRFREWLQANTEPEEHRGAKLSATGALSELKSREELQVNKGAWKPKSGEERKRVQPAPRVRVGHEEAYGHALGIHRAHESGGGQNTKGNRGRKPEALGSANGCSQRIEPLGVTKTHR